MRFNDRQCLSGDVLTRLAAVEDVGFFEGQKDLPNARELIRALEIIGTTYAIRVDAAKRLLYRKVNNQQNVRTRRDRSALRKNPLPSDPSFALISNRREVASILNHDRTPLERRSNHLRNVRLAVGVKEGELILGRNRIPPCGRERSNLLPVRAIRGLAGAHHFATTLFEPFGQSARERCLAAAVDAFEDHQ